MADSLFQANWLDVSIEQQKYFVIMIKTAQQPLYYHGFGIVVLDLETFTKVRTKIYRIFGFFFSNFLDRRYNKRDFNFFFFYSLPKQFFLSILFWIHWRRNKSQKLNRRTISLFSKKKRELIDSKNDPSAAQQWSNTRSFAAILFLYHSEYFTESILYRESHYCTA